MSKTIFFSWQLDTPGRCGRSFLKEVLEEVCVELAEEAIVNEALRDVEFDSDTRGVAGQPPVAETILKKIDAASVFIGDVTFTGKRVDGRPTPNPNVLIEYGWAIKSLTYERVICVMNSAYGEPTSVTLPFDLAHLRRPIQYNLPPDASPETKRDEKKRISRILKEAIALSLDTIQRQAASPPPSFPAADAMDGPARFRKSGQHLGIKDGMFGMEASHKVFLQSGPSVWLRVMPTTNPNRVFDIPQLQSLLCRDNKFFLPPLASPSNYSYVRSADGFGIIRTSESEGSDPVMVNGIAFAFVTGEIWSVETVFFKYTPGQIDEKRIEDSFSYSIEMYTQYLDALGLRGPYKWKAGVIGIEGYNLEYPEAPGYVRVGPGPLCASDLIEDEGRIEVGQSGRKALIPFFKKIYDACGLARSMRLPQE